jgi:GntR family transcriptional regulator
MDIFPKIYQRSPTPLYGQVASVMRQRIDRGVWVPGARISTLEELEQEFSVARVTIRQAIELLCQEGLLDVQQGRGTFVTRKPRHNRWLNLATDLDVLVANIKDNVIKRVHIEQNAAPPELKEGEGHLAEGYAFLRSVQYNNNEPFSVVNLHLARHIFDKDRKRFAHAAALPHMLGMDDVSVARAPQTFTIGVADPETATLLEIGLGEPTADSRLILIDSQGVAIYVANIHYHKNCFALHVELLDKVRRNPRKAK